MCTHVYAMYVTCVSHVYALWVYFDSAVFTRPRRFRCFCPPESSQFPSFKKKKTIIRSRPTSGAAWWQAYVFDPCGTYMSFINTCLLEGRCTAAASWWGKPGAGSACVTGRLLFPFHRWLISLWRLGTARAECMQLFLSSLLLAALWLPD